MLKPTGFDAQINVNRYALVIAVAKRAREIADEAEEKNVILTEKPVSLAVYDFENGSYKITVSKQ